MLRASDFPSLRYLNVDYVKRISRMVNPSLKGKDLDSKVKLIAYCASEMIHDAAFFEKIVPQLQEQAQKHIKGGDRSGVTQEGKG
jgi:hypothetical protein